MSNEAIQSIQQRAQQDEKFRERLYTAPLELLHEYELSEEEKLQFVLPNFSWFVERKIAGVSFPRTEDAFTLLKMLGVKALLNLSEHAIPSERISKFDMQAEHVPLADFSTPTLGEIDQAIMIIDSFLSQEQPIAVHCRAGLGRTGTILACYLVRQGISAEEAIRQVRTIRPGSIETIGQEAVIANYERQRSLLDDTMG